MIEVPEPDPQPRVPVVQRPDYTISLEQATPNHSFGHILIHGVWSKTIKRQLQDDWIALKALHTEPIYALHSPHDHKHEKFLSMFGLRFILEYVDASTGKLTHIYST